jgi:hypothetical protein
MAAVKDNEILLAAAGVQESGWAVQRCVTAAAWLRYAAGVSW